MSGADFSGLLKRRIGLDCASIGQAAVLRAVRLRMQAIGEKDEAGYWSYLQASEEEIRQLIEAVVVPETWFFRYPESLSALAQLALRRGGELRLLSLPCSTGEEPYSIAMALLDAGLPPSAFRIDAVDVSERALEQARIGRYGRNAFRGGEQAFRQRYFSSDGQLSRAVMDCVRFVHGNLFDAGLLSALPPYDFVFCRNLLIYFDSATQTRALAVLTRLVRRDGAIFVGPAEASLLTARGHPALPPSRAFAFAAAPSLAPPASAAPRTRLAPRPAPKPSTPSTPPTPVPAPARIAFPRLGAAADGESLREVAALADQGRLEEAWQASEAHLHRHGPSAQIWYLRGLVKDAAGQAGPAQEAYRKALYLDPAHRQALLQLAALLQATGNQEEARRLRARASRGEAPHG
ncbi:protein-glutamate O-methyltransferase CheR [Bordetella hinzii]|uniref:CheR family methyltransferase n=2 Tax=Bordetella hinzii TaxID=103855 RepID=UPI0013F00000|nr:protein-glutamate O-methyltransferase CheR [Bordetella hinzii]QII86271.1 protein-glutamate O-methyltransferase CheR [Bordetella hinzii]